MRRKLDRFLVLGGVVAVASAAPLSAGLFTIFSAVADDHVDLPSEGVLEELLQDTVPWERRELSTRRARCWRQPGEDGTCRGLAGRRLH